jgi:hypothetical protein
MRLRLVSLPSPSGLRRGEGLERELMARNRKEAGRSWPRSGQLRDQGRTGKAPQRFRRGEWACESPTQPCASGEPLPGRRRAVKGGEAVAQASGRASGRPLTARRRSGPLDVSAQRGPARSTPPRASRRDFNDASIAIEDSQALGARVPPRRAPCLQRFRCADNDSRDARRDHLTLLSAQVSRQQSADPTHSGHPSYDDRE